MQKIFIISEYSGNGTYYYRARNPQKYSKRYSIDSNVNFKKNIFFSQTRNFKKILDSDIVIFLRPLKKENLKLAKLLKKMGFLIFVDNDDLFSQIDKNSSSFEIRRLRQDKNNIKLMKMAHGVLCTNDCLKKQFKKYNKNIQVFDNYIDFKEFSQNIEYKKNIKNNKNILICGSAINKENLHPFNLFLKKLLARNKKIKLYIFGTEKGYMGTLKQTFNNNRVRFIKKKPFVQYPKTLAKTNCNICLIPRKENIFNKCKSACKFLEMSALKIAVIAKGFKDNKSPYQKVIKQGKTGFIAQNYKQWDQKIKILLNDKQKRDQISQNAYEFVKNNFDIVQNIAYWDKTVTSLVRNSNISYKKIQKSRKPFSKKTIHSLKKQLGLVKEKKFKITIKKIFSLINPQ
ncbi:MAG: glycosyltransferase [Candidatus Moranbacteria bacterium]|nr:glycosyltransferase [Candidatus Moranbacteria bacterium]